MMFSFYLRKDIGLKNQSSYIYNLGKSIQSTNNDIYKEKQNNNFLFKDINTKIKSNINSINESLNEKINIKDLHTSVIDIIADNDTFLETRLKTIMENGVVSINTHKEKAIEDINTHYNTIINGTGAGNLLKKIDYLFEMFYHADSDVIMENYPLLK